MKTHYIYAHYTKDTNECFYIGVGTRKDRAYVSKNRNSLWKNIVNKHGYRVEIVKNGYTNRELAVKHEIMLQVIFCPRACFKYGDGNKCVGNKHSQETRNKIRNSHMGKKRPKEVGEKISKSNKGKSKHNGESKLKISIKKRKKVINCRGDIYNSIDEATNIIGLKSSSSIGNALTGLAKTAGKYKDGTRIIWRYL